MRKVKVKKTIYVPDEQDPIPKNKYLQSLFFQSKYQKGRINLNKEDNKEFLMDGAHIMGVSEENYLKSVNAKSTQTKVGTFAINYLKEIIKYAEGFGYETLELESFHSSVDDPVGPLSVKFPNEKIEVNLAPRVEEEE